MAVPVGMIAGMIIMVFSLGAGVIVGFNKSLEAGVTVGAIGIVSGFIVAAVGLAVWMRTPKRRN